MTARPLATKKRASNRRTSRARTRFVDQNFVPFTCAAIFCFAMLSRASSADAPAANGEPIVQPNGDLIFHVQGEFARSADTARESALRAAQDRLGDWLARLDPPIVRKPSFNQIRGNMLVNESGPEEKWQGKQKMFKIGLDVKLTPATVGDLRSGAPLINGEPVVEPSGDRRFLVQGEFRRTLDAARDSALHTAQERLHDWLAKQDPPINRTPSLDKIRREMNLRELPPQEEQVAGDKMYKITYDFEIKPSQVRDLCGRERIGLGMWTLGGLLGILGVIALLFRLDEWTKGYLTWWLIIAGVIAVVLLWSSSFAVYRG